jgi:hypothetical protein
MKWLILTTTLLIAGCVNSGIRSEEALAVCDVWRSAIVVTETGDPRALREQELAARLTYKETCGG